MKKRRKLKFLTDESSEDECPKKPRKRRTEKEGRKMTVRRTSLARKTARATPQRRGVLKKRSVKTVNILRSG